MKPSPRHDENVVCHISKSNVAGTYTIQMNKIVDVKEVEMGPLDVAFDKEKKTLTGKTKDAQGRNGLWIFKVDGEQMHGTLRLNGTPLFRVIEIKKRFE